MTINYLQEFINRAPKPEIFTPNYPADYYEEIKESSSIFDEFYRNQDKVINKLKRLKEFEFIDDVLTSAESLSRLVRNIQISKSEWFGQGGRVQCTKNFIYFQKLLMDKLSKLSDGVSSLHCKIEELYQRLNPSQRIIVENKELKQRLKTMAHKSTSAEKLQSELKSMQQKEKKWNIEKAKFDEELENMRHLIAKSSQVTEIPEFDDNFLQIQRKNETIERLSKKIDGFKYKIIRSQFETGNIKEKLSEKENEIKQLKLNLETARKGHEEVVADCARVKGQSMLYRTRLGMSLEDLLQSRASLERLRLHCAELKGIQEKFDELTSPAEAKDEETVQVALDDVLFRLNLTSGEYSSFSCNFVNYQFTRPSFKEMLNPQLSKSAYYTPAFKHWVYFVVRGIYDSKFYEHSLISTSANSHPTRFVDFVYSWLSSFSIDQNSRNVTELEWWKRSKADEIRLQFLLGLSPEVSRKSWELTTFKEFLNESRTMDELYFFLHVRFMLLQSPQMLTTAGKFSRVHMVNLKFVIQILSKVFYKVCASDMEKVRNTLSEKAKTTRFVPMIDLAIVLRVSLELFKQEKFLKYSLIRNLFDKVPREANGTITFFNFRHICKNLSSEINELDVVRLYRDCWTFSEGKLESDVFYVMANENGIFTKILKLPGIRSGDEILNLTNAKLKNANIRRILEVVEGFKAGDKEMDMIKFGIDNMGILELSEKFNKINHLMLNYLSLPLEDLWIWTIEDLFQRFWGIIVACQSVFIECNSSDIKLLAYRLRKEETGELDVNYIRKATQRFVDILFAMNLNKIKSNIAARKIQQIWKLRANRNLGIMSTVVKSVKRFKGLVNRQNMGTG